MGLLADRLQRIGESATLRISAKAKQLKAEGIDVIDLSIGEPDFNTPENIKQAAKKAIDDNFTHYTANPGIPELKKAIMFLYQDWQTKEPIQPNWSLCNSFDRKSLTSELADILEASLPTGQINAPI